MSTEINDIRFLNQTSLRQFYQNSRNNIEDPIFTGFTMEIDTLHSPLFFALAGDEYVNSETLRSAEGTDTGLAQKIEEKLAYVNKFRITGNPDSYEINTLEAKDKFGTFNDRRPGYGLWDKYDMDNILYGAADYIYMVDKVSDGAYTDDYGVIDLGDGTPTTSEYEGYNKTLKEDPDLNIHTDSVEGKIDELASNQDANIFFDNDKSDIRDDQQETLNNFLDFLKKNPDCAIQIDGYASKDNATAKHNLDLSTDRADTIKDFLVSNGIDPSRITTASYGDTVQPFTGIQNRAVTCKVVGGFTQQSALQRKINDMSSFSEDVMEEHNKNLKTLEDPETGLKTIYESLTNKDSKYQQEQDELKKIKNEIDSEKNEVKFELSKYQREMSNYEALLKSNSDKEKKDYYSQKINEVYEKFEKFINFFTQSRNDEEYSKKYEHITADFSIVRPDDDSAFKKELEDIKDSYDNNYKSDLRKAWAVTKTKLYSALNLPDTNKKITDLQKNIENESKEIFGVHPDGRMGTENDPAPESACFKYLQAKSEVENDKYTQQKNKLNELQEIDANYKDLEEYNLIQANKNIIQNALPSIDYTMSPQEEENPTLYSERINKAKKTRVTYEVPQTVYDMMGFIRGMDELIHKYPYAMQTVAGLDEAYKKYFDLKDPYMGSGDGKITINCLDYLDMRVSSMFNKYFNATYDRRYRRERVPINLRRFQCSIFVHDIRNFKDTIDNGNINIRGDLSLITEIALNSLSAVEFKFYDCEIVPEETGSIFDNVTNITGGEMRTTNFTFTYGNCVINFLPFEDLRRYVLNQAENKDIKPKTVSDKWKSENFDVISDKINSKFNYSANANVNTIKEDGTYDGRYMRQNPSGADLSGNFRRWFDKSELGNVNNNDYREYVRNDSAVAVDDYYKTTIVNNFALGSVAQKNKQLTEMDDALRRIVVGISASTGIPVKGVTDALNIQFIDPILNEKDLATPIVKNLGNVTNSRVVDEKTMEYVGKVQGDETKESETVKDLGNVEKQIKGGK